MSINRVDDGSFVSLAPDTSTKDRDLALIKWSLSNTTTTGITTANTPVVVAKLGNAHPPRSIGGGDLGYIAGMHI